jgi:hypothetical protein
MKILIAKQHPAFKFLLTFTAIATIIASAHAEKTPPVLSSASGTARIAIGADKTATGKVETPGIGGIAPRAKNSLTSSSVAPSRPI